MSQPLGKVTGDLAADRGPDVELRLTVEHTWFGRAVDIKLPRNLNCAACSGGGCDRCERAGALSLWERGAAPREIQVVLPPAPEKNGEVCIRVPGEGALPLAEQSDLGRGHLLLWVRAGTSSDQAIVLCPASELHVVPREELIKRSAVMAICLIALFFGMLKLSGWL